MVQRSSLRQIQIRSLTNKQQIANFLNTDRAYHAYALADLDERYFSQCAWWAAENSQGDIQSLVLVFYGLTPPVILTMGETAHLPHILARMSLPSSAMVSGVESHIAHLRAHYRFEYLDVMWRMTLKHQNFRPVKGSVSPKLLAAQHLNALQAFYQNAHGNAFAPYQLEKGVFYGIFNNTNLIAVAGTHIVAPHYGVAAVGNIFTHSNHRNTGFAQQTTSAVCSHLFALGIDTIVLNVMQSNLAAIHVYKKLGFKIAYAFAEGIGDLKNSS